MLRVSTRGQGLGRSTRAISQLSSLFPEQSAIKQVSQTLRRACNAQKAFSMDSQGQHVKQINMVLTTIEFRKRLGWVKDEGAVFACPIQIAKASCTHWTGVT